MVLADHFGRRMASEIGWADWPGFGAEATDALIEYGWPGNVRELRNVIERAVYRWEREGPIDGIEFDPFKSPYRPATRGEAEKRTGGGEGKEGVVRVDLGGRRF